MLIKRQPWQGVLVTALAPLTEERFTYYGPHLCRALECLKAGYPENAVSWMVRDLGELDDRFGIPDPSSLETFVDDFTGREQIVYRLLPQSLPGLAGEGI